MMNTYSTGEVCRDDAPTECYNLDPGVCALNNFSTYLLKLCVSVLSSHWGNVMHFTDYDVTL